MVVFISTEDVIIKGDWVVMSIEHSKTDVILIGGGIMSATLGTLLKDLSPEKKLKFSKNWNNREESSNVWNNLEQDIQLYVN